MKKIIIAIALLLTLSACAPASKQAVQKKASNNDQIEIGFTNYKFQIFKESELIDELSRNDIAQMFNGLEAKNYLLSDFLKKYNDTDYSKVELSGLRGDTATVTRENLDKLYIIRTNDRDTTKIMSLDNYPGEAVKIRHSQKVILLSG